MKVEIIKGSPDILPGSKGATSYEMPEKSIIHLPFKSSTGTKLHELYHAKYSPRLVERFFGRDTWTASSIAIDEMDAEGFSQESRGQPRRIPFGSICRSLIAYNFTPNESLKGISIALEKKGYPPLKDKEKSYIWDELKTLYKEKKKGV
jgi:hypothetical protein